jgi:hypothetical protein
MNNKIDEIQKQIDTLNHMLLTLQASLDNEKQKEKEDEKERIFYEFDEDTTLECISDKVRDFSTDGAEFEIRTGGKYKDQGFFLGESNNDFGACPWEIVLDDNNAWVLKLKEI